MKKMLALILVLLFTLSTNAVTFAVELSDKDGKFQEKPTVAPEPLATIDPNAVRLTDIDPNLIENQELEDKGTVWLDWNGKAYAKYGCSPAIINYTNPIKSNIGVVLSVGIYDGDLIKYFGTTFRDEEEINKLALEGFNALHNGIEAFAARRLTAKGGIFEGEEVESITSLEKEDIFKKLGEIGFLNMTEDQLKNLSIFDVYNMSEIEKLTLATLCEYDFYMYRLIIGDAGLINPGYALYKVDLYNLPGRLVIPTGEYKAFFELNGYDENKNAFSDFHIRLPITLYIQEDLPEELQEEYELQMAKRIDQTQADGQVVDSPNASTIEVGAVIQQPESDGRITIPLK